MQFPHLHLDFSDKKFLSSTLLTNISEKFYLKSLLKIEFNLQILRLNHANRRAFFIWEDNRY
jgi:hypothetical protein